MSNELQLIEKAKTGSVEAFTDLVESYRGRLFRYLLTRCDNYVDAEDALQDTMISAYKYLHSYNPQWLSLIHISEPTRLDLASRMPSSA